MERGGEGRGGGDGEITESHVSAFAYRLFQTYDELIVSNVPLLNNIHTHYSNSINSDPSAGWGGGGGMTYVTGQRRSRF